MLDIELLSPADFSTHESICHDLKLADANSLVGHFQREVRFRPYGCGATKNPNVKSPNRKSHTPEKS